jgi:predicted nucleic acid-binding protein
MKKILIDTNIVLDIALQRREFGVDAKSLIMFIAKNRIKSYFTASSITDIYYVLRKEKGHINAIEFLKSFIKLTKEIGVDEQIITDALSSEMIDFEDAVQTETAICNDIDIIITRDRRDFKNSGLQVFSPKEYISEFNTSE